METSITTDGYDPPKNNVRFPDTVTVDVTLELIKAGVALSGSSCPVALAARANFPGYHTSVSKAGRIFVIHPKDFSCVACYDNPDAGDFVEAFDYATTETVAPTVFQYSRSIP